QGFDPSVGFSSTSVEVAPVVVEPQGFDQYVETPVMQQATSIVPTPLENRGIGITMNLSDKETLALNTILTAKSELLSAFEQIRPTFLNELGQKNLSTKRIFNEFSVKAVSDNCLVMVHESKIQVALINKILHEKNIKEALTDTYKPLNYVALTQADWENVLAMYDEISTK
ncbi:MAG: hypothetical protein ABS939_21565, partial [Psychrobacillus sp.]